MPTPEGPSLPPLPTPPPLGTLGWRGRFGPTDPPVVRLRAALETEAGLRDELEVRDCYAKLTLSHSPF
jgi:hypothetical protein